MDTGLAGADLGPHGAQAWSRSAAGWLGCLGKSLGLVGLSSKAWILMPVLQVVISTKVSPGCVPSTARDTRQVLRDGQVMLFSAVRTAPAIRAARPREGRALGVLCFLSGEMTVRSFAQVLSYDLESRCPGSWAVSDVGTEGPPLSGAGGHTAASQGGFTMRAC